MEPYGVDLVPPWAEQDSLDDDTALMRSEKTQKLDGRLRQLQDAQDEILRQAKGQVENRAKDETAVFVEEVAKLNSRMQSIQTALARDIRRWQDESVPDQGSSVAAFLSALVSQTRQALILRGHPIESIRAAKVRKHSSVGVSAPDTLLEAISSTSEALRRASAYGLKVVDNTAALKVQLAELEGNVLSKLQTDLGILAPQNAEDIKSWKIALDTYERTIKSLEMERDSVFLNLKKKILDNINNNSMTYLRGGPLGNLFAYLAEGDFDTWIDNDMKVVSQTNDKITTQMKDQMVVKIKIQIVEPLITQLNNLRTAIAALHKTFSGITTKLNNAMNTINRRQTQVDQVHGSFNVIGDPSKLYFGTETYVRVLAASAASAIDLYGDAAIVLANRLLQQLSNITIPQSKIELLDDSDVIAKEGQPMDALIAALKSSSHTKVREIYSLLELPHYALAEDNIPQIFTSAELRQRDLISDAETRGYLNLYSP